MAKPLLPTSVFVAIGFAVLMLADSALGQSEEGGVKKVRGVHPSNLHKYHGSMFSCDGEDGSARTLPVERVNDDYCDCDDGSDEPGTSACSDLSPSVTFFCANLGHVSVNLSSSKVNDGVCDCCDGSDEWAGDHCKHVSCRRFAEELLSREQDALQQLAAGLALRRDYEAQGQAAAAGWDSELAKRELEELQLKDEARRLRQELSAALPPPPPPSPPPPPEEKNYIFIGMEGREAEVLDAIKTFVDGLDYLNPTLEFDHEDLEDLVRQLQEKCPELDLSRNKVKEEVEKAAHDIMDPEPEDAATEDEEEDAEDDGKKAEAEDDDDDLFNEQWKPKRPPRGSLAYYLNQLWESTVGPYYDEYFRTDVDKVRAKLERAKHGVLDSAEAVKRIKAEMARDFGIAKQYYPLNGQCYEEQIQGYTYTFCPYDKVEQKAVGGKTSFSIGKYSGWQQQEGEGAPEAFVMLFSGGDRCPANNRQGHVLMACGSVNKIVTVQEARQCEYEITFVTPAACTEEAVAAVRRRVEEMEGAIALIDTAQGAHSEL